MHLKTKWIFAVGTVLLTLALTVSCKGPGKADDTTAQADETQSAFETTLPDPAADEKSTDAPEESETTAPETVETAETTDYFEAHHIETVAPREDRVADMAVIGEGYDIYRVPDGYDWGYRYGCSYLYNPDGSVDAYFACVGRNTGEWDWISYRHSPDNGETWEPEKIVLTPTQGSMDMYSCCDPGVVYFDGYYYLGYTSTVNGKGHCNNIFVARSEKPDGPFEKWNGSGWGGYDPKPIAYYDQAYGSFGIGEPSFIELNGTLYIYYTESTPSGEHTMVATADATNENWPATMQFHGSAVKKNTDSLDIKYVEEWGKFVGVATGNRFTSTSYLAVFESNDGLHFTMVDAVRKDTYANLHNAGLSSRPDGHIRLEEDADRLRVVYAYACKDCGWGLWNTHVQPISLQYSKGNNIKAEMAKPSEIQPDRRAPLIPKDERHITMADTQKDVYRCKVGDKSFRIGLSLFDDYFNAEPAARNRHAVFSGYDEAVIQVDNESRRVTPVGVGMTTVTVTVEGVSTVCHVVVEPADAAAGSADTLVKLEAVQDQVTIYLGERTTYKPQIRARAFWGDHSFTEMIVNEGNFPITFGGYDESVIRVDQNGVVSAQKAGETDVTVTVKGQSVKVHVTVTEDESLGHFRMPGVSEMDFTNLDFSNPDAMKAIGSLHNCAPELQGKEMFVSVNPGYTGPWEADPFFSVYYNQNPLPVIAEDYTKLEITYRIAEGTSTNASNMQMFFCTGSVTAADPRYQVKVPLKADGEAHTIVVDLTRLSFWKGDVNMIRYDFFDAAVSGDGMYISSIRLVK